MLRNCVDAGTECFLCSSPNLGKLIPEPRQEKGLLHEFIFIKRIDLCSCHRSLPEVLRTVPDFHHTCNSILSAASSCGNRLQCKSFVNCDLCQAHRLLDIHSPTRITKTPSQHTNPS